MSQALLRVPEFRREPFGEGGNSNAYLDRITRLPLGADLRQIPVATVSKRYALIQHRQLLAWISEGIRQAGVFVNELPAEMLMSEYGERIKVCISVPEMELDPGDHFPIHLVIQGRNSVDRSCAFQVSVAWRRLVCSNGMWVDDEDRLRKVHNLDWMNRRDVVAFIKDRVGEATRIEEHLRRWLSITLTEETIRDWVDNTLARQWGIGRAARVFSISMTGYDGSPARPIGKEPAHRCPVSADVPVPGACAPVSNLYHLAQALVWVAEHTSTIEEETRASTIYPPSYARFGRVPKGG